MKTTREDEEWVLWHINYESAFLNANLDDKEVYIEWPEGMVELGFMTQEEFDNTCARLGTSMYGNVDAAMRWFYELTDHMTDKMDMTRSLTDPCVIFKKLDNEMFKVATGLNVDDTMLLARKKDAQAFSDAISQRFNITVQHEMKKHLGVDLSLIHI